MPDIKDAVGDGGTNAVHDVAMVQLMLRVVKDAKNTPYFGTDYTGVYDNALKNAIIAFQKDQKLLPVAPAAGGKVGAVAEKQGLIAKNSQTQAKLNALLPAKYATAIIIENTKTIYLAMDEAIAKASSMTLKGKADLDLAFRGNVATLVTQMFQKHKIALTIPASGWNRTFADQANIPPAKTGAGPGESNHNYGKAVDIGFDKLQWVKGNGDFGTVDFWLENGGMPASKQDPFWKARNAIAGGLNLFPTFFPGDLIHLQAFNDANVGYASSLAVLLNTVTVKHMKWQAVPGHPNHYKNDMGLGGAKSLVGTARQIWAGNAQVAKADLVAALNAKLTIDKKFDVFAFFGVPPNPKASPPTPPLKEADIKDAYLAKIKADIKADFVAADANRGKWKPLP